MDEKNQEYPQNVDLELPEEDLELDAIMKEFSPEEDTSEEDPANQMPQEETDEEAPQEESSMGDTVRIEIIPGKEKPADELGDTIRLDKVVKAVKEQLPEQPEEPVALDEPEEIRIAQPNLPKKEEPYSENWEPEYEQPMGEYIPPQPLVLHHYSKLHELKRKLVAGPERRYYEINEVGFGKLQAAIFCSLLIVLVSGVTTAMYAMGMVPENRMKLLVFGQFLALLLSAALGSNQLISGVTSMLRGRFTLNSLLFFSFAACCADGVFGLMQQRVSCCAAFSLQVTLSLWSTYHKRSTEMDLMDTMPDCIFLRPNSTTKIPGMMPSVITHAMAA